ncbi:type I methionyl aminopeptidase [Candidatus Uhrbacteria bacterium]|nr:type I methionyl aminopeptidase [Candidatus Uhrbacteria bacterium]
MVTIKKPDEIIRLREGGTILARALATVAAAVKPGVCIADLDALAHDELVSAGGVPAFFGYRGSKKNPPYPATLCVSINDEVVHGIGTRKLYLKEGDIVGLDIGVKYPLKKGLFTDMAVTVGVGRVSAEKKRLMNVAQQALDDAIAIIKSGVKTTDISKVIQKTCEKAGYSVVRDLTGHGVGYEIHEDPPIFCFYQSGMPETVLQEGMVIAIEPMVCAGDWRVIVDDDQWTIRTTDGKPSAHFEHTIVVTRDGYKILTLP